MHNILGDEATWGAALVPPILLGRASVHLQHRLVYDSPNPYCPPEAHFPPIPTQGQQTRKQGSLRDVEGSAQNQDSGDFTSPVADGMTSSKDILVSTTAGELWLCDLHVSFAF